jgi:hypothetical protein
MDRGVAEKAAQATGAVLARRWRFTIEDDGGTMVIMTPELDEHQPPEGFEPIGWAVGIHLDDPQKKTGWFRQLRIFGKGGLEFTTDIHAAQVIRPDKRKHAEHWAKKCDGRVASVWKKHGDGTRFVRWGYE